MNRRISELTDNLQIRNATQWAEAIREKAVSSKEGVIYAADHILRNYGSAKGKVQLNVRNSQGIIKKFVLHLIDEGRVEAAATILWGTDTFNWRPRSTRMIFNALQNYDRLLVPGAASMSKSFSAAVWLLMDWYRDPLYTCVKVVSVTAEHAKRNIFAHIKNLHRTTLVPMGGLPKSRSIQENDDEKQGIHLVAIPQGDDGSGRLQGFHPVPRSGPPHPIFGQLSRIRAVIDEAEICPGGVWGDIDNILAAADEEEMRGMIKIIGAFNPVDRHSKVGKRCEPVRGWNSIDIDSCDIYDSKMQYHIVRLDAAKCENVVHKRLVYPGFQTLQGYTSFAVRGETPEYFTMARGWFPEHGLAAVAIPSSVVDNSVGTLRFTGPVTPIVSGDLALEGVDQVMMTVGRFGLADGWYPRSGQLEKFEEPYMALQIDQQVAMPKLRTMEQAEAIRKFCRTLKVGPIWLCVDRTGNGAGIHDSLVTMFGSEVMGVNFGWGATELRVFEDDKKCANELYDGIVTELIFAMGRLMEYGRVKISPSFRHDQLIKQLSNRHYKQKGELIRIESKKDYIKRTQERSPDEMDSASLLVHLWRSRSSTEAVMVLEKNRVAEAQDVTFKTGYIDQASEYTDMSE